MDKKYAAIIGLNPSKGARSPKLWNLVYEKIKSNSRMICIDIEDEEKVSHVIRNLENDENFLGGCIAYPYKETIFKILGVENIDKESSPIGAVNCIYRSSDGSLIGSNSDGFAALYSFKNQLKQREIYPKSILIAGLGGAGKAVSAYFGSYYLKKGLDITCISRKNNAKFCQQLGIKWLPWSVIKDVAPNFEAFVNCTTLGSIGSLSEAPIDLEAFNSLKLKFVYDIIYDPSKTELIKTSKRLNINYLNGLEMNLFQAARAFKLTNNTNLNEEEIKKIMASFK